MSRGRWLWFAVALAALPARAPGQLVSPGKLAAPHAGLEGIRNCTQCHQLGRRGVSRDLCLGCHTPLAARLGRNEGFHATLAEPDCASCHKDHFGADFGLVKLDVAAFDHDRTGYVLEGAHGAEDCRSCHVPDRIADPEVRRVKTERAALERTFLGLPRDCTGCHTDDDPHGDAFAGQACTSCHDQSRWTGADGFDHARTTFPLTGLHRRTACEGCHVGLNARGAAGDPGAVLRFDGLAFGACVDCHDDPHGAAMDGPCSTCHTTAGWRNVDRTRVAARFDHRTTGFGLTGRHAGLDCAACHDPDRPRSADVLHLTFPAGSRGLAFPAPAAERCASCHVDRHAGLFDDRPGGSACTDCHGDDAWRPADYDLARHNAEAAFRLEGAHAVVPCATCHETPEGRLKFDVGIPDSCAECHDADGPHGDQFEDRGCDSCHGLQSFVPVAVDHSATRYPLTGAHAGLSCTSCHPTEPDGRGGQRVRYRPLGMECSDCHGGGA